MIKHTHWLATARAETTEGRRIVIQVDQIIAIEEDAECTILHLPGERIRIVDQFDKVLTWMGKIKLEAELGATTTL